MQDYKKQKKTPLKAVGFADNLPKEKLVGFVEEPDDFADEDIEQGDEDFSDDFIVKDYDMYSPSTSSYSMLFDKNPVKHLQSHEDNFDDLENGVMSFEQVNLFLKEDSYEPEELVEAIESNEYDEHDENSENPFLLKNIKAKFKKDKQENQKPYKAYSVQSNQESVHESTPAASESDTGTENIQSPWDMLEQGVTKWEDFSHNDREKIIKHHASKLRYLALRMKVKLPKHVELSELISAGTLGLMEALGKFQPQLGIRFDTYAESRIRGAMIDELRRLDWFPRSLRARVRQIDTAVWHIENEKGRQPTTEELAKYTGIPEKEVAQGLEALQSQLCISLDAIQDSVASDATNTASEDPYQSAELAEMVDKISNLIDTLTAREKLVLSLYYNDELNMREASEVMNITEGRVSQLHTQAISRLRRSFFEQYGDNI